MKVAIITAGSASMFCGSCMQDNTLARALMQAGNDVALIPLYTPIRVDETDVSGPQVFLGAVNVYLDSVLPGWSRLPRFLKSWLDHPQLLKRLTRRSSATDAAQLGWLTVDMLQGPRGPQGRDIEQLVSYLTADLQPDVVIFSNALVSGIVPTLKHVWNGPIVCLLQGDDIFLDALPERWRRTAVDLVRDNCRHFDRLWAHSHWYADELASNIGLDRDRFDIIPLSLDTGIPSPVPERRSDGERRRVVGYFARVCPEKGADRFLNLAARTVPRHHEVDFRIAGYLPERHRRWFLDHLQNVQNDVGFDRLCWMGSPETRQEKFAFLASLDLLCVPERYREPKGLFVLEAALAGVPSLLPRHGAFPERIAELGQGWLYDATSEEALDRALSDAIRQLGQVSGDALRNAAVTAFGMDRTGPIISERLQALPQNVGRRP